MTATSPTNKIPVASDPPTHGKSFSTYDQETTATG